MKLQTILVLTFLQLTAFSLPGFAQVQKNIFAMSEGCVVVSCSSDDHSSMWSPLNAFDGDLERGWATERGKASNQEIVLELPQKYKMRQIVLNNENAQDASLCAKTVEIFGSSFEDGTGFKKLCSTTAAKLARTKIDLPGSPVLRRIKFVIVDNWGDNSQIQIMELEGYGEALGQAETASNFATGTFSSALGAIKLRQNGSQISGCIEKDSGTIYGALTGNIMRFEFYKDADKQSAPQLHGAGLIIFNGAGAEANGLTAKDGNLESLWLSKKNNMIACYCKMPARNSINSRLQNHKRAILFGITFNQATASITPESEMELNDLLEALKVSNHKIQIEGYSDATGTTSTNIRLSQNRAQAVCDWLKSHSIDPGRLSIKGFGDSRPIGDNTTPQGRYLNNRIEISLR